MDALLIPTFLCPKAWEDMSGDVAVRFCIHCKKHVHNLEALSVSERLAQLSSPAASVCSRYKVAIRRPAKGKEESYMRHMMKYGVSVALTGSVLLVLWEMHTEEEKRIFYRAVAGISRASPYTGCGWSGDKWPNDLYEEQHYVLMGEIAIAPSTAPIFHDPAGHETNPPPHIDLYLDPATINQLLNSANASILPQPPVIPLKGKFKDR